VELSDESDVFDGFVKVKGGEADNELNSAGAREHYAMFVRDEHPRAVGKFNERETLPKGEVELTSEHLGDGYGDAH